MSTKITPDLVDATIQGDAEAQGRLVRKLTPVIQYQVAKMLRLWRTGPAAGRDLRQEVEDLVQEVLLEIFDKDARILRRWRSDRGPLEAYVHHVARNRAAEVLRSRASPWREEPVLPVDLDRESQREKPDQAAFDRDLLSKIYLCLLKRFRPEDSRLFEILFLEEESPQDTAEHTGKSLDAVYKWRSRLYQRARECWEKLSK
jgi:RNA polymerase sigma factor (sigma-70 family)